jgi:release factor H-coupled RctB family protein
MTDLNIFGAEHIEGTAIDQARLALSREGAVRAALCPDAHPGKYGPVGMVLDGSKLFPLLMGNDIGCGFAVFALNKPMRKIKSDKVVRAWSDLDLPYEDALEWADELGVSEQDALALGTIGLGNHFCELSHVVHSDLDTLSKGSAVLFVHSGSRGLGEAVLSRLPEGIVNGVDADSDVGQAYLSAHDDCLSFARANRFVVAQRAAAALGLKAELLCDVAHNFVAFEGGVWRHRKGVSASAPLTPVAGSRDSASWLVAGELGNKALSSLPHGAGRKIDRSSCQGRFKTSRREKDGSVRLPDGGRVICGRKDLLVQEDTRAYKDTWKIKSVIENEDLGRVVAQLMPQVTFKTGEKK